MLSNILHTFSIELPKGPNGDAAQFDVEMTDGAVSYVATMSFKSPVLIIFASQASQAIPLYHQATLRSSRNFDQGELCRLG